MDDGQPDFALMVTTICFVDDPNLPLKYVYWVLRPGGVAVINFNGKQTTPGERHLSRRWSSAFCRTARSNRLRRYLNHSEPRSLPTWHACRRLSSILRR
jgi:SAM-dependent methyltransferase